MQTISKDFAKSELYDFSCDHWEFSVLILWWLCFLYGPHRIQPLLCKTNTSFLWSKKIKEQNVEKSFCLNFSWSFHHFVDPLKWKSSEDLKVLACIFFLVLFIPIYQKSSQKLSFPIFCLILLSLLHSHTRPFVVLSTHQTWLTGGHCHWLPHLPKIFLHIISPSVFTNLCSIITLRYIMNL